MTVIEAARPAIDLTRYHFVRELGDIRLYGTWLYHAEDDDDEPCLVMVSSTRSHHTTPCCVALSAAFRYDDPRYLAQASLVFARTLGFDDTLMSSAHKIGSIIHDHLLDLIKMPENPTEAVVGASANVDFGDGRRRSVEIVNYVPIPQA
ncbi:hypothetical protein [Burkholderia mayonis]|uniref:Uncharacterized protein n=1 Tax=Burkholderia mayonis TaxID=1385591 RepID=A0A1B4G153_9BURK|nr:hypothetical protein [Burkholderia mayonis]AOJ09651.1 hypothetical protein WS71_20280 [Burkholderia mayonis]KVE52272.1 hypothetical protein WS71_10105 [Burkholderia mayonis]